MIPFLIRPAFQVRGRFLVPFDKSITHRAVILSAISQGVTKIKNFSSSLDCFYTLQIFKQLGVKVKECKDGILIYGKDLRGLTAPKKSLYVGESGTTIRILLGLLAGQDFESKLEAAPSLNRRPMARVINPLFAMGAKISAKHGAKNAKLEFYPPLVIKPSSLHGIKYRLEIPSAQVKSAILLAGLYAKGKTEIIESKISRDHTERMLKLFGADININKAKRILLGLNKHLTSPGEIKIPGDFSSAIFFIIAALIIPGSKLKLRSVGLNPTRVGALKVLQRMKADIKIVNFKKNSWEHEPMGDIIVTSSKLYGTKIRASEIPSLIDELPILMVVVSQAIGSTIIEGAKELRVKETDRINSMVTNLSKMGVNISVQNKDNIIIKGPNRLHGANLKSFGDHRTAMSLVIAGLCADKASRLDDISCVKKSLPEFKVLLKKVLVY